MKPLARAFFQEAAGKALTRSGRRSRRGFGGGKLCLERRAAAVRQRTVVNFRVEPAIGDQHLMRMYAPAARDRLGPRQGRAIDAVPEQEVVLRSPQRLQPRGELRVLAPKPERLRYSRHGKAPSILP